MRHPVVLATAALPVLLMASSLQAGAVAVAVIEPTCDQCVRMNGRVEVEAPPAAACAAVLDLGARVEESAHVDSVWVYHRSIGDPAPEIRARWDLSILGVNFAYHTIYRTRGCERVAWELDRGRDNSLRVARGEYRISPVGLTRSRIDYTFEVATRIRSPAGLRQRLAARGVRKLLRDIRERAEKAP
jgi:hypothetical protein